jgi:hypothetical protein
MMQGLGAQGQIGVTRLLLLAQAMLVQSNYGPTPLVHRMKPASQSPTHPPTPPLPRQIASLVTALGQDKPLVRNILTLGTCAAIPGAEVSAATTGKRRASPLSEPLTWRTMCVRPHTPSAVLRCENIEVMRSSTPRGTQPASSPSWAHLCSWRALDHASCPPTPGDVV